VEAARWAASATRPGTFDSLSYDVSVDTSVVSNISLSDSGNSTGDFSPISTGSQSSDYFAGSPNLSVFAGGKQERQYGFVDNLSLSRTAAVPEPSTAVRLASAGRIAATAACRRRKRVCGTILLGDGGPVRLSTLAGVRQD
jgi:hypothetical protein